MPPREYCSGSEAECVIRILRIIISPPNSLQLSGFYSKKLIANEWASHLDSFAIIKLVLRSLSSGSSHVPPFASSPPQDSYYGCGDGKEEAKLCKRFQFKKITHRYLLISVILVSVFIIFLEDKIMSLHHHHHHHQQHQGQEQEPAPVSHSTAISSSTSTVIITASSTTGLSGGGGALAYHHRSSSTSPHQRYSSSITTTGNRQLHQQHFLPPRPPSTTSSGSISTGFPDDQDDSHGIMPPLPPQPEPGAGGTALVSSSFAFHPAHHHPHTLQYHRHSTPQGGQGQQVHHHHHHHHFVPASSSSGAGRSSLPGQQQYQHHQHCQFHIGGGGGGATPGSSRAASRHSFGDGDEEEEGGRGRGDVGGDEDNLLLVDNSVGVQDAVYLDPVTTDNFLTNIVQRFKRDFIYTYVGEGTLLVSVNPYKPLSIFSPRVKAAYRNISNPFQLPPHIYGQLCLILQRNTSSLERPQTLLLTGESGSGKSTNLSYLLDFLSVKQEPYHHPPSSSQQSSRSRRNSGRSTSAASTRGGSYNLSTGSLHRHQTFQHVPSCPHSINNQQNQQYSNFYYSSATAPSSGRASSLSLRASSPSGDRVATKSSSNMALALLQGNFLLNAFGNCKTSKNWDASRFGKLVQLQIDFLGNVCGGRLLTYQLEKWRVQGPNFLNSSPPNLMSSSSSGDGAAPAYERNFHIFYILLAGADSSTLKSLRLTRNLETYGMLNVRNHSSFLSGANLSSSSGASSYPATPFCPHDHYYQRRGSKRGSSSYEGCFQLIKTTLASILPTTSNISADNVFKILAGILKLNNLVFVPVANIDGTEGCDVTNEQDLQDLAYLLSISPSTAVGTGMAGFGLSSLSSPVTPSNNGGVGGILSNHNSNNHQHPLKTILTTRRLTRSDGTVAHIELTASESSAHRNSLSVSLYTRLFAWLTKQVSFSPKAASFSTSSDPPASKVSSPIAPKHNLLNIIDFYGFEVFSTNSLEQFLINFTNEKIQYVLGDLRLRLLQEEFVKDGLEWITIDTTGSSPPAVHPGGNSPPGKLIDLVEENCHGLLSIFANCGNDVDLERQFSRRFSSKSEEVFPKSPGGGGGGTSATVLVEYLSQSFRIRHWAGPVTYSTKSFATKNRDNLPPHLPHQLYSWTTEPLLKSLFSHDGRMPPPLQDSSTNSRLLSTSNMELSLRNLFQKCLSSGKHHRIYYIRCLKPNELSQPAAELCELALLKHQVKYHRLIDFVRVYRDGFTYNLGGFEFLERYKLLSLNTWPNWRHPGEIRLGIQVLMKDLQMKEGFDWCFGGGGCLSNAGNSPSSTLGGGGSGESLKVYLKGQRILSELEDFRRERLDDLALLIQKIWRGYRDWKEYRKMREAHTVIRLAWRKYLLCKRKEQRKLWKNMKAAVRLIQQRYILWKRRLFLKQLIGQVKGDLQLIGGVSGVGGNSLSVTVGGLTCPGGTLGILPGSGSMLSPISRDWPYSPSYLEEASFQLRRVFHRWRCRLYRSRFNETERAKMAEKVTSSLLFKDKKTSYLRSVSHPFLGDYIRLRQNSQWRRTTMMMMLQSVTCQQSAAPMPTSGSVIFDQEGVGTTEIIGGGGTGGGGGGGGAGGAGDSGRKQMLPSQQLQIVFADLINKITRSSGKFLPTVLVVTTTQIMILDPRTLNIKYKIPATEVWRLSVSPYGDDICVIHLQQPLRCGGGSVMGPGDSSGLFGGILSDEDDAYYQFGDEPSPTGNPFGQGSCICSSSVREPQGGPLPSGSYYGGGISSGLGGTIEQPSPSPQQSQCQVGSQGCGLFSSGGGQDSDSGHYATSEVVKLTKGDLVFHTCHLIEMVTKIYLVVKNATGKGPELIISNEFPAVFNNQRVQLCFRYSKTGGKSAKQKESNPPEASTTVFQLQPSIVDNPPSSNLEGRPIKLVEDGSIPGNNPPIERDRGSGSGSSAGLPLIPPPPPPTFAAIASSSGGKEEPVIPPSQIKITRKRSTRMEFLIGHSS